MQLGWVVLFGLAAFASSSSKAASPRDWSCGLKQNEVRIPALTFAVRAGGLPVLPRVLAYVDIVEKYPPFALTNAQHRRVPVPVSFDRDLNLIRSGEVIVRLGKMSSSPLWNCREFISDVMFYFNPDDFFIDQFYSDSFSVALKDLREKNPAGESIARIPGFDYGYVSFSGYDFPSASNPQKPGWRRVGGVNRTKDAFGSRHFIIELERTDERREREIVELSEFIKRGPQRELILRPGTPQAN